MATKKGIHLRVVETDKEGITWITFNRPESATRSIQLLWEMERFSTS